MARPIKEGLDYFPLDVDITQDDKFAMVEAEHGNVGFAVMIKLLAKIYKEGYVYSWGNREQKLFAKKVNVDINEVNAIVNTAIEERIFNKNLFDSYGVLTSKGIQMRYLEAIKRRKEVTFVKEFFLITDMQNVIGTSKIKVILVDVDENLVNVDINPNSSRVNGNISTQRKGKETKGEESKPKQQEKEEPAAVVTDNIFNFYQNNFGPINSFLSESIGQWIDETNEPLVLEAMKRALKQQKKWNYAEGILKRWVNEGIKDVKNIPVNLGTHQINNHVPDWIKEPKKDKPLDAKTEEENQKWLESLLKGD